MAGPTGQSTGESEEGGQIHGQPSQLTPNPPGSPAQCQLLIVLW
jgi:hypothetical protein